MSEAGQLVRIAIGPEFWLSSTFVLGLVVGSFLNVVILRLPVMLQRTWRKECREFLQEHGDQPREHDVSLNLIHPPSSCPVCGHRIRPWENIPLFSYVMLGGKCANCRQRISLRYPIIELTTALITIAVMWVFGPTLMGVAGVVLSWSLIALSVIDFEHQLLPDSITLPLLWLGLILNSQALFVGLNDAVWGAVGGYMVLWSVYWLFKIMSGKEGMGFGDFKLLAALGAWLGWQALPAIILLSSFVGAAVGIGLITLHGRDKNVPIPFGPFLAIAGWIVLLFGDAISAMYLDLMVS